jgi:hypothetical protein
VHLGDERQRGVDVTDENNAPDGQPDRRTAVATDEQAAQSGSVASGGGPASNGPVPAAGGPAPTDPAPTGAAPVAPEQPAPVQPAPVQSGPVQSGPVQSGPARPGAAPAAPGHPGPVHGSGPAAEPAGAATPTPAPRSEGEQSPQSTPNRPAVGPTDAPTGRMRVPANGSGASTEQGFRPAPRPGGPAPSPGPVPGPGPDAATPPPWRRIPGRDAQDRPAPARQAVGGALGDGPTAFLQPAPQPRSGDDATAETGGWSPVRATRNRPPRQAALQLRRLDPWSVLKLALVLAVVLFFVWLVAVGVIYGVLDGIGVWDRLNGTYADLVSGQAQTGAAPLISAGRVFGLAAVIGAVNSLLFAVAVTIAAFVYNVSADLVGGIEVTLSERD